MQGSLQRYAIDSRTVLRGYARLATFFGLFLMTISAGFRLTKAGSAIAVLSFGSAMGFALLMGMGFIAATIARIEDAQLRRRIFAGFLGAQGFVLAAIVVYVFAPVPFIGRLLGRDLGIFLVCFPGQWFLFNGVGAGADEILARWFGPVPIGPETETGAHERQIREAAGQEERHRLARDLHDSIKQEIFAIHTSTATAQARFDGDPDGAKRALEQVRASARDAMTEMEAMLDRLHTTPLENTGLEAALRRQCEALALRTGADVTCDITDLPPSKALAPGAHEAILRIAQEALSNVARHARATKVRLILARVRKDQLLLSVEDNGGGLSPADTGTRRGMGQANMYARARAVGGSLRIDQAPGSGVVVRLTLMVLHVANDFWPEHRYLRWVVIAMIWILPVALVSLVVTRALGDPEFGPAIRSAFPGLVVFSAVWLLIWYVQNRKKPIRSFFELP